VCPAILRDISGKTVGNYDDWDQSSWGEDTSSSNQFDDGNDSWGGERHSTTSPSPGSGGWHWLLTLVALVTVGVFSMGMAWLTRDVDERPVWMMGLIFMVPTAALMIAAMMVESATSAMTPGTSRGPQLRLALIATLATFVVAVICDLVYLQGFKKELAPAASSVTAVQVNERLILVHDDTFSMKESGAHEQEMNTVQEILSRVPEGSQVGLISPAGNLEMKKATEQHKSAIAEQISRSPERGRLYFADLLEAALEMIERSGDGLTVRMVFLTDGSHPWTPGEEKDFLERCLHDQAVLYCISFGNGMNPVLTEYTEKTGGAVLTPAEAERTVQGMAHAGFEELVAPAEVEKEVRLQQDLIRNRDPAALIITCVMLTLEGLSLGICLSLMLSVTGQFRFQYILSPLMAVLAFFLLKMVWSQENMATTWWIKEGVSFSLLGIVFMARNRSSSSRKRSIKPVSVGNSSQTDPDDWG